jgi:glutamate synthase (NADPH/NADH) large chain
MTGGAVYQQLSPELGFDEEALQRRLAQGAKVAIKPLDEADIPHVQELLAHYIHALQQTDQYDVAERIEQLGYPDVLLGRFVKVVAK